MKKRKVLAALVWLMVLLLAAVLAYASYVYLSYGRIEDHRPLAIDNNQTASLPAGKQLTALTANIGFGAYSPEFSFFMDGGKWARAVSGQEVEKNTQGAIDVIKEIDPALVLMQEVDVDGHRSHHVDQMRMITQAAADWGSTFAVNYDSAYLAYPFHQPIGKSLSGLLTLSRYAMEDALRRSLPIEEGFAKLLDLDRCFSQQRIKADNGRYLTLINVHPSAYVEDATVQNAQVALLFGAMEEARANGDYVICGGDFNRDLLGGESSLLFGFERRDEGWTQPLETHLLPEGFTVCAPVNAPTVRDAGTPYTPGETFSLVIDGFIVSDDVQVLSVETVDMGFAYSDHNPVRLDFVLQ